MGFRLQHAAAVLAKEKKRKKSISKIPASMINHPVESVLTNKDLLVQVFSFLPMNDIQACGFVSKIFYQVIEKEIPLKLRIEDRGKNLLWIFRPSWKLDKHGRSDRDEMVCPFFKIGSIPPKTRKRVNELTLVMRLVQERLDDYDLESMVDILKDFTNLEYLRVMSSLGPGDTFCSLFQHKSYFPQLRTVFISGYCLDVLGANHPGLVRHPDGEWLAKEFHFRTRGSTLQDIVQAAPNIEHLEICSEASGSNLRDLIPLSKSLRKFRFTGQKPIRGDLDDFLTNMPLLHSWDLRNKIMLVEERYAHLDTLSKNLDALSILEAPKYINYSIRRYHDWYMMCVATDQHLAYIYFFKCYVTWLFTLKDEDKNRSDLNNLLSVWKTFSLDYMTEGTIGSDNIGSRLVKKDIENGLAKFCSYFSDMAYSFQSIGTSPGKRGRWKRMLHLSRRYKIFKIQERYNRQNTWLDCVGSNERCNSKNGAWSGCLGLQEVFASIPYYFVNYAVDNGLW